MQRKTVERGSKMHRDLIGRANWIEGTPKEAGKDEGLSTRWAAETILKAAKGEEVDPSQLALAVEDYQAPKIYTDPTTQQQKVLQRTIPAGIMKKIGPLVSAPAVQAAGEGATTVGGMTFTDIPGTGQSAADLKLYKQGNAKFDRIETALNAYSELIEKHGSQLFPDEGKNKLKTAYTDLQMELKELFNLGVLNGPDLAILEKALTDPTTFTASVHEMWDDSIFKNQVSHFRNKLNSARKTHNESYGNPNAQPAQDSGQITIPTDKPLSEMTDEELDALEEELMKREGRSGTTLRID